LVIIQPLTWEEDTKIKQARLPPWLKKAWSYKIKTFTLRFKVLFVLFQKQG